MELYFSRNSGNSARSVFALHESGVEWRQRPVDPRAGETRTAEYVAKNPMGKIPTLVHGGFTLWESNAINLYLAEAHPDSRLLPAAAEGRAAVQRWLFFQAGHVTPAIHPILRARNARIQAFWNITGDPQAAEAGGKELARYLSVLEEALAGRDWLEGEFSLADIAYAPHLFLLAETEFDFSAYPAMGRWLNRLLARPAWERTAQLIFD